MMDSSTNSRKHSRTTAILQSGTMLMSLSSWKRRRREHQERIGRLAKCAGISPMFATATGSGEAASDRSHCCRCSKDAGT